MALLNKENDENEGVYKPQSYLTMFGQHQMQKRFLVPIEDQGQSATVADDTAGGENADDGEIDEDEIERLRRLEITKWGDIKKISIAAQVKEEMQQDRAEYERRLRVQQKQNLLNGTNRLFKG